MRVKTPGTLYFGSQSWTGRFFPRVRQHWPALRATKRSSAFTRSLTPWKTTCGPHLRPSGNGTSSIGRGTLFRAGWQILLFEFWTDAGLFSAVFTIPDRLHEEQDGFKLSSEQIEHDYYALPNVQADAKGFDERHAKLQQHYFQLLSAAAATPTRFAKSSLPLLAILNDPFRCGALPIADFMDQAV